MRNRKERYATQVYRLRPLHREGDIRETFEETKWEGDDTFEFVGVVDDVVFVSVPPKTSYATCERIKEMVSIQLGDKRDVMIVSHNIELLSCELLDKKTGASVLKQLEEDEGA